VSVRNIVAPDASEDLIGLLIDVSTAPDETFVVPLPRDAYMEFRNIRDRSELAALKAQARAFAERGPRMAKAKNLGDKAKYYATDAETLGMAFAFAELLVDAGVYQFVTCPSCKGENPEQNAELCAVCKGAGRVAADPPKKVLPKVDALGFLRLAKDGGQAFDALSAALSRIEMQSIEKNHADAIDKAKNALGGKSSGATA